MTALLMQQTQILPDLFRSEYSRITAVLCRLFGLENIETAEDIASDTFLQAAETWGIKGLPDNPVAWLYTVSKNKTRDHLRRNAVFREKVALHLRRDLIVSDEVVIDLSDENIIDSQLQMMFALCHPSIPVESQIGLSLRILCGFGIDQIADAFLTNKETINKRLFRAREKLRSAAIAVEMPGSADVESRTNAVLATLYLLFNEGYHSQSQNISLRKDLCLEAMRLAYLLTENKSTNLPTANALLSLMCFHASRFDARTNMNGDPVLYHDQDIKLWDQELIARGENYLNRAANGNALSKYHIEAAIAYWHTNKTDSAEKWENILQLYNNLLVIQYSPIAALNRTYVLSKTSGRETAIHEAEKLDLQENHLYHSLLGSLYCGFKNDLALTHLEKALSLARSLADRKTIETAIEGLNTQRERPIATSHVHIVQET